MVVKSDGSIWFSDNGAGIRGNYLGDKAPQELPFRVYRIDGETGEMTIAVGDMERPNGLCFSPDETRLYVVDTPGGPKTTHVYDVVEDGTKVGERAGVLRCDAGLCGWHPLRHRGQCLVWLFRRRGPGRRRGVRSGRHVDRPHPVAGALRQCLLWRARSGTGCSWRRASRSMRCMSRRRAHPVDSGVDAGVDSGALFDTSRERALALRLRALRFRALQP